MVALVRHPSALARHQRVDALQVVSFMLPGGVPRAYAGSVAFVPPVGGGFRRRDHADLRQDPHGECFTAYASLYLGRQTMG